MMATLPQITSGSGLRKFRAEGFLFDGVYMSIEIILTQEFTSLHLNTRSWRHETSTVLLYQPRNITYCSAVFKHVTSCDLLGCYRRCAVTHN